MSPRQLLTLALGDPSQRPGRTWPLLVGLILGTATWIVLAGLTRGAAEWVRGRVSGSLANRIRVTSSKTTLGPLQLGGGLKQEAVDACKALPGVRQVFRQAHFPGPCQLFAHYHDQRFSTDLILEGVDPGQVAEQLAPGQVFEDKEGPEVPVVIPQPVLDVLNAGISAHTDLPNLSAAALVGRTINLKVGSSSFAPGPSTELDAPIVGVSDQLGVNGPALPLAWVERHARRPVEYHTLTLDLAPDADLDGVLKGVERLGLSAPDLDNARRVNQLSVFGQALAGAFSLAILVVAGTGIASGFTVKVQLEREDIGLYRSLGATRRVIAQVYLVRAAALGSVGALWGVIAGLVGGYTVARLIQARLPQALSESMHLFQPSFPTLVGAALFAPLVAIAAAWWPARSAAALDPGKILRGS